MRQNGKPPQVLLTRLAGPVVSLSPVDHSLRRTLTNPGQHYIQVSHL